MKQGINMKKLLLKPYFLLLAILFIFAFTALNSCSRKESEPAKNKLAIAVIPKGSTNEFWKAMHAGAVKASHELDVEVIWKGPLKEDDRESQIKVVEDFITRGVSGIVLAPLDETALRMPVQNATRSGISVVIIDSGLKSDAQISFVATDNYVGGIKAGQHLASLLNQKGKVAMLRYLEGSASTSERERGFLDAMAKYPGIEIVSSNQYSGPTTETAYKSSENMLAPLRSANGSLAINGIFCPNESSTFGMLRALQDGGQAGKVQFVGFDSSEKLIQALASRQINGLILQDPMNMGYLGVKTIVAHLRGRKVEKTIDTGSILATPENMNNPQISAMLKPDFTQWLNEK